MILTGGVFDGWERLMRRGDVDIRGDRVDRRLVKLCRRTGFGLISRDGRTLKRARAVGVDALTPEELAARHLERDAARAQFSERLDAALDKMTADETKGADDDRANQVRMIRRAFSVIWAPF